MTEPRIIEDRTKEEIKNTIKELFVDDLDKKISATQTSLNQMQTEVKKYDISNKQRFDSLPQDTVSKITSSEEIQDLINKSSKALVVCHMETIDKYWKEKYPEVIREIGEVKKCFEDLNYKKDTNRKYLIMLLITILNSVIVIAILVMQFTF